MTSAFTQKSQHEPIYDAGSPNKEQWNRPVFRGATALKNAAQMGFATAYINGFEVPDSAVKGMLDAVLPVLYQHMSFLLVPYEWVLNESEELAERSHDLMQIQYDLPEELFDLMLGESDLIYPKYTMALWEKGASNILEAQQDMLDDVIEKLDIKDGDNILDLGCGFGSACNYILSRFPNAKVTGLNLSHTQCEYMRKKMNDSDSQLSSDRFTLIEQDFNEVVFETEFENVVEIGLLEHIGNLTER